MQTDKLSIHRLTKWLYTGEHSGYTQKDPWATGGRSRYTLKDEAIMFIHLKQLHRRGKYGFVKKLK